MGVGSNPTLYPRTSIAIKGMSISSMHGYSIIMARVYNIVGSCSKQANQFASQHWQWVLGDSIVQWTARHFIFMDGYRFAIEKTGFKHILHARNWLSAHFLDKEGQTNYIMQCVIWVPARTYWRWLLVGKWRFLLDIFKYLKLQEDCYYSLN